MDHTGTGRMIAEARREKGLTQKQLADRLHVSDRTVSKWETGKGFPDPALLEPLADALQLPLADIVCGRKGELRPDEDARLREMFGVLRSEVRRRTVRMFKRLLLAAVLLLIAENVMFHFRTGGDGTRRWEDVKYFREAYEFDCARYPERGVYRMEWLSGAGRTVITDDGAIAEVLALLRDMELGKEWKDQDAAGAEGYLTVAVDDGEMEDSVFVLSFPAFTISEGVGAPAGKHFCYEAAIRDAEAGAVLEETVEKFVEQGKAQRFRLGLE